MASKKHITNKKTLHNRASGYIDALESAANEKMMLKWFENMEYTHGNDCDDSVLDVKYNRTLQDLEITFQNKLDGNYKLPMKQLSDWYRNTLGMVADIIQRIMTLNPHLGKMF